jgi:hypothetical protein
VVNSKTTQPFSALIRNVDRLAHFVSIGHASSRATAVRSASATMNGSPFASSATTAASWSRVDFSTVAAAAFRSPPSMPSRGKRMFSARPPPCRNAPMPVKSIRPASDQERRHPFVASRVGKPEVERADRGRLLR